MSLYATIYEEDDGGDDIQILWYRMLLWFIVYAINMIKMSNAIFLRTIFNDNTYDQFIVYAMKMIVLWICDVPLVNDQGGL